MNQLPHLQAAEDVDPSYPHFARCYVSSGELLILERFLTNNRLSIEPIRTRSKYMLPKTSAKKTRESHYLFQFYL